MDLPLSLVPIGAVLVALLAHRLTISREKLAARRTASVKFRQTVLGLFSGWYPLPVNWPDDIDRSLRIAFPTLQAAVAEFRPYVPWWRRRAFDRAWFRYRCGTGREIDLQNYHHYIAFDSNPNARVNFQKNVADLIAFSNRL
jgi:hypothetical protein